MRTPLVLAALLFFGSGAGALVVEASWQRWLRLALGGTAAATSATLIAFFAGQALGALLVARRLQRTQRPLLAYGLVELGAAAASALVPLLLAATRSLVDARYDALLETPSLLVAARFGAALLATLPASVAFGASFPLLAAATLGNGAALGRRGGLLYAVNTGGAALGAALAAFVLPEALGVSGGYAAGSGLLALVGTAAVALGRSTPALAAEEPAATAMERTLSPSSQPAAETSEAPRNSRARRRAKARAHGAERAARAERLAKRRAKALAARRAEPEPALRFERLQLLALLSGLASLAAQVLFTQAFARVLNQSAYAFGAVLVVTLLAMALGAAIVTAIERTRAPDPRIVLAAALALATLGYAAFPRLFVAASGGLAYLGSSAPWPAYLFAALGLAATTAGPALVASGGVWPALLACLARTDSGSARAASAGAARLLVANTLGAIAGAALAPFVLLPLLGLWPALVGVGAVYGLACISVSGLPRRLRTWRDFGLALGWIAIVAGESPWQLPLLRLAPGETALFVEETAGGAVAVIERAGERRIQVDNHYALGGTADRLRQEREGHLPLLLHPQPRRVAFLGSATGSSAAAALAHPSQAIALVELTPGVARAARLLFRELNRGVYDDPRTRVVLDDARSFLRATRAEFDVIVGDLFVPWQAGTGALYAREHFEAARARLAPGGIFCQWLPLYQLSEPELASIFASFARVFPEARVFRGDFYARHPIIALVGGDVRLDPAAIAQRTAALRAAGSEDRWVTHPLGVFALYVGPLAAAPPSDALENSDDQPVVELLAAKNHAGGERGKLAPFTGVAWVAFAKALREAADARGEGLGEAERRAMQGGHALQAAAALFALERDAESSRALAAASEALPRELFADAPADPSAAEVWHTRELTGED